MYRIITTLILTCFFFLGITKAQVLKSKLNIGFGIHTSVPLNAANVKMEKFEYPSLWGNTAFGLGGKITGNYKISSNFYLETTYEKTSFTKYQNDNDIFILENPSSGTIAFSLGIKYAPGNNRMGKEWMYTINIAPLLLTHQLKWDGIKNTIEPVNDNNIIYPTSNTERNFGLSSGISFYKIKSIARGIRFDVQYQYVNQDNLFYLDDAFHTLNLSFVYYFRFMKNKYYLYE